MLKHILILFVAIVGALYSLSRLCATTNFGAWDNVTVGSTSGNISTWDGVSLGITTGNINAWNGLAYPASVYYAVSGPVIVNGNLSLALQNSVPEQLLAGQILTLAGQTSVAGCWIWQDAPDVASNWGCAVYTDATDTPVGGSEVANCSYFGTSQAPISGWNFIPFSGCTLAAGTKYWIANLTVSAMQATAFDSANCPLGTAAYVSTSTSITSFPATFPAASTVGAFCVANGLQFTTSQTLNPASPTAVDLYFNGSGGSSGNPLSGATLDTGTHGTNGSPSWGYTSAPAETYESAANMGRLLVPVAIGATNYDGTEAGALGISGTTTGSGSSLAPQLLGFTPSGSGDSIALGFWFQTNCVSPGPAAATLDCGAIGGARATGGDYAVAHINSNAVGAGKLALESVTTTVSAAKINFLPNTKYRVDVQLNKGPSATNRMTVCDANANLLGTMTAAGAGTAQTPNAFWAFVTGEEPAVSGYQYQYSGVVIDLGGTNFSTSACSL